MESAKIELELQTGLRSQVDFGIPGMPALLTDAQPPLGEGLGPDSEQLLLAAVGNCLAASLVFALRKFGNDQVGIKATAEAALGRNERNRLRVQSIAVDLRLSAPAASLRMAERAVAQFEDFCVVTQSVRAAIPVTVRVVDSDDVLLSA